MSFTATRAAQQENSTSGWSLTNYIADRFCAETAITLESVKDRALEHLYEDLSELDPPFIFKGFLKSYYTPSQLSAFDCLELALTKNKLYHRNLRSWTDHALRTFDPFLLQYIQEVIQEQILSGSKVKETEIYEHLKSKTGAQQSIGEHFSYIYQYRNKMTHRLQKDPSGKISFNPLSSKQLREIQKLILQFFAKALQQFGVLAQPVPKT